MKPLVKKILESGLVDKHVAKMMERWCLLDEGAEELVGKSTITKETLQEFVDDIEDLLEKDSEMRETRLEVQVSKPPVDLYCPTTGVFSAVEDMMGKYVVSPKVRLDRGSRIWPDGVPSEKPHWTALEVEPLYQGDVLVAYQVTVDKPE